MKLYIKAAEDDSNKLPVDPELENIFHELENAIRNDVVYDINDKLGQEIFYTRKQSNNMISYDDSGRPYFDSYTAIKATTDIKMHPSDFIRIHIGEDPGALGKEHAEVNACLSTYSPRGLEIQVWYFPLTKDFSYSKYVLEPDFVENTCKQLVDDIVDLCNEYLLKSEKKKSVNHNKMDYDEWYYSDASQDDGWTFLAKAESILKEKYPGCIFEEEPSVQGYRGSDLWWLTYQDNQYFIEFDWSDQMFEIYDDGPEYAAKDYANRFIKAIDSGEALEE